jgi:hypothetical protein
LSVKSAAVAAAAVGTIVAILISDDRGELGEEGLENNFINSLDRGDSFALFSTPSSASR